MVQRIQEIETNRLMLREFQEVDAPAFYALNSYPDVLKYTGDLPFQSLQETRDFISNYDHYKNYGFGRWAVLLKESEECVGWCGLKFNEEKTVDLGFRLLPQHWNKGYASEAALKCLEIGFKYYHLKEIVGRADKNNGASHRVLEKIGMKLKGKGMCDGIPDALFYSIDSSSFLS